MMKKPTCVTAEGAELTMTKNVIIDIQKLKVSFTVAAALARSKKVLSIE